MFISLPCFRKETLFPLFSYPNSFRFLLWYHTIHRQPSYWRNCRPTEAPRAEKIVFETAPLLSQGLDHPPPPPLTEGLDRHCFSFFYRIPIQERHFVQTLDCEIVPGGYSWEFLVGWVPPCSPNLDSISDHTCFQTWPPKSLPVFRPGGGRSQNTTK